MLKILKKDFGNNPQIWAMLISNSNRCKRKEMMLPTRNVD